MNAGVSPAASVCLIVSQKSRTERVCRLSSPISGLKRRCLKVFARRAEKRLSVAIYIHDLSPGGVERQNLVLARELRERDVDVSLVLHQMRGELIPLLPPGVPVVNLDSQRTLQDVLLIRRYLRAEQPSVFMANVDHNNVAASLANALAGYRNQAGDLPA